MTANYLQDIRTLPYDRPVLGRHISGEDVPIRRTSDRMVVHIDGEWSGFWHVTTFVGWQELPAGVSDD
jgi:hypothetical protein